MAFSSKDFFFKRLRRLLGYIKPYPSTLDTTTKDMCIDFKINLIVALKVIFWYHDYTLQKMYKLFYEKENRLQYLPKEQCAHQTGMAAELCCTCNETADQWDYEGYPHRGQTSTNIYKHILRVAHFIICLRNNNVISTVELQSNRSPIIQIALRYTYFV